MSGRKEDPILLDSDSEQETLSLSNHHGASEEDLGDAEFAIVKERFYALQSRYGSLWRSMVPDKENNCVSEATPQSSATKDINAGVGCNKYGCNCTSPFMPVSLLRDSVHSIKTPNDQDASSESTKDEVSYLEENSTNGRPTKQEDDAALEVIVESFATMGVSRDNEEIGKSKGFDKDAESISEDLYDEKRPAENDSRMQDLYGEDLEDDNNDEENETEDDDDNDDDDDDDDNSDQSTVLQWDSWSDPKQESVADLNSTQENATPATIEKTAGTAAMREADRAIAPEKFMVDEALANFAFKDDEKSLGSLDSERSENEATNPYNGSESEPEWDGFLEGPESGVGDLIELTKTIEIQDSSDEDVEEKTVDYLNSESEAEWEGLMEVPESGDEDLIKQTTTIEIQDSSDEEVKEQAPAERKQKSREFKKQREILSNAWFKEFDELICDGRLGEVTSIVWSKTLNTTAGQTRMKTSFGKRTAVIELATKVLDTEDRLRNTLIHEMCHAAAFVIDRVTKPPHGDCFKKWANRAMRKVRDVKVTTLHDYVIKYKFFWACSDCDTRYGRHSRTIDVKKHRCGKCQGGLFECTENGQPKKPRATSAYQIFIRESSAAVRESLKQRNPKITQVDVLQECARLWGEQKTNQSD